MLRILLDAEVAGLALLYEVDPGGEASILVPEDGIEAGEKGDDVKEAAFFWGWGGPVPFGEHLPTDGSEADLVPVGMESGPSSVGRTTRRLDLARDAAYGVVSGCRDDQIGSGEQAVLQLGVLVVPGQDRHASRTGRRPPVRARRVPSG